MGKKVTAEIYALRESSDDDWATGEILMKNKIRFSAYYNRL